MSAASGFDLNTASVEALCAQYPNLGLFLAQDIVAWREQNGPFTDAASLVDIVGDLVVATELARAIHRAEAPAEDAPPPLEEATAELAVAPPAVVTDESPPEPEPAPAPEPEPVAPSEVDVFLAEPPLPPPSVRPPPEELDLPMPETERRPRSDFHEGSGVVVQATSQTMSVHAPEPAPEPAPPLPPSAAEPEPKPSVPPPAPVDRSPRRFGLRSIVVPAIVMANVGLGVGLASLRQDERQARAPVAALSADVKAIRATEKETHAELEDTRTRLDEQEATLAKTIERLDATEQRQRDAERAAKEHADRDAKELAALSARMGNVERKVDFSVHNVDDALKILDLAQGKPARPAGSADVPPPSPKATPKPDHAPPAEAHPPAPAPSHRETSDPHAAPRVSERSGHARHDL
ncbi:MAG: helix-hairpin-helix domain-containing protein [Labilithrix sp.]